MADDKKLIFRLVAQNEQYLKKMEQSEKAIRRFESVAGTSIQNATKQFNSLGARPTQSVKKFGKASNDSFSGIGRGAGQASIQLQQFVGQVQAGTNPLLAFSQQAADVGIVLGAPLVGAILGIGSAIAISLLPNLQESAKEFFNIKNNSEDLEMALKELQKRVTIGSDGIIEYTERVRELAKVSKAAAEVELSIAIIQAEIAVKSATAGIVDSVSEIENKFKSIENRSGGMQRSIKGSLKRFREELGLTAEQAKEFRTISQQFLQDPTVENAAKFNDLAFSTGLANEKLRSFIEDLNTNLVALNQNKEGVEKLKTALDDLGQSTDAARFTRTEEETKEEEKRIQGLIRKKLDAAEKEDEIQKDRLESRKDFINQNLSIIAQGLNKESALGKAAFAAQKAVQISQMVVNTQKAVTDAYADYPYPANIAIAASLAALGGAAIGIASKEAIASFEGGGYTGNGPRSGGMDGRGGKLAMLHPNEKVIDLQKGAANDTAWKVEVHNYGNSRVNQQIDEERRIVSVMIDQARNTGGPWASAMRENSNYMPKGRR